MSQKIFGNLFLSIGAMKAGTTWLYAVLERHPKLHFTLEKEIHYFYHRFVNNRHLSEKRRLETARNRYLFKFDPEKANIDRIRGNLHWVANYINRPVDDFWYRNLFNLRDHEVWACDFSNLHAHLPVEAWPQIHESCDKLKVLYTMRHPMKRLWSHTKFHLQTINQLHHLDEWGSEEFERFVRLPHIWNNAEYGAVLRRIKAGLPEEDRKVIFFEDLHADQRGILRSIEEFLNLPAFNYPEAVLERRFNRSESREMPDFFPDLFAEDVERIKREIEAEGYKLPSAWDG